MQLFIRRMIFMVLAVVLLTTPSCKKGWLDINYDPQQLTDAKAEPYHLLPVALRDYTPGPLRTPSFLHYWLGYLCPPPPYPTGFNMTTYNIYLRDQSLQLPSFTGAIPFVMNFEEKSRARGEGFYLGIAKTLKALLWIAEVDQRNNVPYREFNRFNITQPKYDEGRFIYEEEMKQLDSAITLVKNSHNSKNIQLTTADIMFHGDKIKWIKFINTQKLRMLLHQANRPDRQSYIDAEMAKIKAEGSGFLNSGENASVNPGYFDLMEKRNPFYIYSKYSLEIGYMPNPDGSMIITWEMVSANTVSMDLLKANNDPRLGIIFDPIAQPLPPGAPEPFIQPSPSNYRGNKLGLPVNTISYPFQNSNNVSQLRSPSSHSAVTPSSCGIIRGYNMDNYVITSTESLFMQAEAIQRGWLPGDPEQAYKEAVRESFRWLNVGENSNMPALSDGIFNTWYNNEVISGNPQVSWAAAPDKYKLLMLQKYLGLHSLASYETWTDYRRNGRFPDLPASLDPARVGNGLIPIRLPYSETEYSVNAENVNAQGEINVFTSKIWWMP